MSYTNSSLVNYTKISPNKTSPRNHAIDTITIHCMAGNLSIERCGDVFAPTTRKASSNYGIGSDGRIALYVEEKDRSWCTSNAANDNRAVTIEVANDGGAPDWHVSDKAMASLINLVADICKRNNIKKLIWSTNKSNRVNHLNGCNMTVHRDYAAKACPGNYLYNRHSYIATEVNKKLSGTSSSSSQNVQNQISKYTYKNIDYSRVFDPIYYSNTYSDLKAAFGTDSTKLFNHFCNYGMKEGRVASASFNVNKYKSYYSDLQNAFGNDLSLYYKHYVTCGYKENRKCV
ncbi:MAG: N-acetylmuramoyl-L-alanine amidase [Lachnospiraceae bacterium]|nr:N-acetylmuramoyl-L-alanine amidase [Lachnospiraceae bacterium]MBD5537882.1 N-acetylmuramoyl-L-alanine amidase [Lachnospiraceae bacterium]